MKKLVLLGLAGLTAIFGASSDTSANGRYCLHYPGNPNCLAVFYEPNYGYVPPPPMVYQRRQIIYFAPPMVRYAQPYIYYGRRNEGGFQYGGSGKLMGVGRYHVGGHHMSGGDMGGGKNGGGKNGG